MTAYHTACPHCKKSLITIQEAEKKRTALQDGLNTNSQRVRRSKRLTKTPAEVRSKQDDVHPKAPMYSQLRGPHAARQINFQDETSITTTKASSVSQNVTVPLMTTISLPPPLESKRDVPSPNEPFLQATASVGGIQPLEYRIGAYQTSEGYQTIGKPPSPIFATLSMVEQAEIASLIHPVEVPVSCMTRS